MPNLKYLNYYQQLARNMFLLRRLPTQTHKMISSDLTTNMLNHCYLLSSSDDTLLNAYAMFMAKEILCLDVNKPCDKCVNCEKINHSNMVDLNHI